MSSGKVAISVVILTFNEEANIEYALKSIYDWASEIFVVDSYSTDRTLEIARMYTNKIYQHPFENFAQQRNWASKLPISNDWIFYLDADEQVTNEMKRELKHRFSVGVPKDITTFAVRPLFFFLGKPLRFAHQGTPEFRLIRRDKVAWEFRGDEWLQLNGKIGRLKSRIIHHDHRDLEAWINKQNRWSTYNAQYLLTPSHNWNGANVTRRVKYKFWHKLPLFGRPILYFIYRYFIRLGFLDGIPGLVYAYLHAFWYRFLCDAKYYEMKKSSK